MVFHFDTVEFSSGSTCADALEHINLPPSDESYLKSKKCNMVESTSCSGLALV